jgi:NADPH:quinone reductase-like Zn-dependent oxidoreductase
MTNTTMKAVVSNKYGGPEVLVYTEIAKPSPKDNEILVQIKATSVTGASIFMRSGKPYFARLFTGLTRPKITIQGTDLAGVVVAIGKSVQQYKVGDKVIASTDLDCGTYAEYICLAEDGIIVQQPHNMTAAEATGMIDGATTALSFFRDSIQLKKGQKVLINGASGSIGTAAIQLAKYFETEVTAVCSGKNEDLVRSLGADFMIDYNKEDFATQNIQYDVIFDTVGKLSYSKSKKALSKEGTFLTPVLLLGSLFYMLSSALFGRKKLKFAATGLRPEALRKRDLLFLKNLIEDGKLKTVIDREYSLNEIQAAHSYVEKGHKMGNVVVTFP